ncbi:MAG: hypothetical protein IKS28_09145 [Clostridia bacterium]|nr:hypothetical protein [Clostridia bacterium]
MKILKIFSALLAAAAVMTAASSCLPEKTGDHGNDDYETLLDYGKVNVNDPAVRLSANAGMTDFDSEFIRFMTTVDYANRDFMISPLSLKYALALAAAGANGATRDQILNALGVSSLEELERWTDRVKKYTESFYDGYERELKSYGENDIKPKRAFDVANSAWVNRDKVADFKQQYAEYVREKFGAEVFSEKSTDLKDRVNSWVNDKTKGLIPNLVDDGVEDSVAVLVNTLYLMDGWAEGFSENNTVEGYFRCADGTIKNVYYLRQTENFLFYCDSETELVVIPMKHGIDMVFVLGSTAGLTEKIGKAQKTTVNVSIPKFETETELGQDRDDEMIIRFLKGLGITDAFGDRADFSPMLDGGSVYIDKIIQKTKISVDEQGVEAAAATALIFLGGLPNYGEPVDFRLDRPFSYGIYYSENRVSPDELLFFGQYTGVE